MSDINAKVQSIIQRQTEKQRVRQMKARHDPEGERQKENEARQREARRQELALRWWSICSGLDAQVRPINTMLKGVGLEVRLVPEANVAPAIARVEVHLVEVGRNKSAGLTLKVSDDGQVQVLNGPWTVTRYIALEDGRALDLITNTIVDFVRISIETD